MPLEPLMVIPALSKACSLISSFDWIPLTVADGLTIIQNPCLAVSVQINMSDLGPRDDVCNTGMIATSAQGYQICHHQSRATCAAQPIHVHS